MGTLRWGSSTDVGRVRQLNEDSLWTSDRLFAVADGMGGHAAGEVASAMAISEISQLTASSALTAKEITTAIERANEHIVQAGRDRPDRYGMGTTLSGLGLVTAGGDEHWVVFNVGDSRVYRFAAGVLTQLTVDHSAVQELVTAGFIARQEARAHPRRNIVTRSLGSLPAPKVDVWVLPLVAGDRFLVCSDGLTTELEDAEIDGILADSDDPRSAADELVKQANLAGGHDNVTVVVVDVVAP
jgi:serine/threonine protein phosphatase PrpC